VLRLRCMLSPIPICAIPAHARESVQQIADKTAAEARKLSGDALPVEIHVA
jgi:hypothetical protein